MSDIQATKRIDAGIKRGPKVPKVQRRPGPGKMRRSPITGAVEPIPPDLKPVEVLQRYMTEETTSQIASHYGVRRKALVRWLREVAPAEWKAVQLVRAHDRKEVGNEQLESADDALALARAREIVKSAQWELQALDPDYRPKQEVSNTYTLQVDADSLGSAGELLKLVKRRPERIIEQDPPEGSKA